MELGRTARLRLIGLLDQLRSSLWFLPTVATFVAGIAAEVLGRVSGDDVIASSLLFSGGSSAARSILGTIAGSMITVTGLTFSLTVVALQVASGQFTPRLLRTFLSDRGNQVVLSAFIATFAYSLLLLRTVRDESDAGPANVPGPGVSLAIGLTVLCVALLVYFIHHLTDQLRVESVMAEVVRETLHTIESSHAEDANPTGGGLPNVPHGAARVRARRSGYLQSLDLDKLFDVARAAGNGVNVRLRPQVGDHVTRDATLAWVWPVRVGDDEQGPIPFDVDQFGHRLHGAIQIGADRTMRQDVAFGIRQLVDIAVRALSPGVNDPTTAVEAVHKLTEVLLPLGTRPLHDLTRNDDEVVVGVPRPDFADYLGMANAQIRRYGADEPEVVRALAAMLRDLAEVVGDDQCRAVEEQVDALAAAVAATPLLAHDLQGCQDALAEVGAALEHRGHQPRAAAAT